MCESAWFCSVEEVLAVAANICYRGRRQVMQDGDGVIGKVPHMHLMWLVSHIVARSLPGNGCLCSLDSML